MDPPKKNSSHLSIPSVGDNSAIKGDLNRQKAVTEENKMDKKAFETVLDEIRKVINVCTIKKVGASLNLGDRLELY